jgi:IS5 family transposase
VRFVLTAGQVNECTQADRLLKDIKSAQVIAEKGYD